MNSLSSAKTLWCPAIAFAALVLLLPACSEAPTETASKTPEPAPQPITGRQAFQRTYPSARIWAADCQPLRIRSINLDEVKSGKGTAGAWEIIYVSMQRGRARTYTWSAVEAQGNLHKGVFPGQEEAWGGSSGQEQPFSAADLKVDTPEALATAVDHSQAYLSKPGVKPPVSFILEFTQRFPDPVWRVLWGASVSAAQHAVTVDATTGKAVAVTD
jgi:hypothetical protein